jgi:putative addiction module component (TIGR02574 family)
MAHIIDVDQLNNAQRIELANYLWDCVEGVENNLSVSEWHKEILDERINNKTSDTSKLKTWDEVREELKVKHKL